MLLSADQRDAARIALLRSALIARPDAVDLRYDLAELLIETGAREEGTALFAETYRLEPRLRPASLDVIADHVPVARRSAAIAHALLEAGVAYPSVIAAKAWAAAVLGDSIEVRRLVDLRAFLYDCPEALDGLMTPDFERQLEAEILAGMTTHQLPWSAIKQASRDSRVLNDNRPAGQLLARHLRAAVDAYADGLPEIDHPFVAARPHDYSIHGWCVMFDGASRHISHIHPRAWLSGVFYLRTDGVPADNGERRGWLRVGAPDGIAAASGWDERWIEPKPGRLVLMPSFFTHETTPTGTDEPRICIAFDIVPAELNTVCI